MSYVWPDQAARWTRLLQALEIARTTPAEVGEAGAVECLAAVQPARGRWTVVWHFVMWQYLRAAERRAVTGHLARAGALATVPDIDGNRITALATNTPAAGSRQTSGHAVSGSRQLQRVLAWPGQAPVAKARTLMTMKVVSVHRPGAVAALRARASSARRARAGVVAVHQGFERRSSQASVSPSPAP